MTVWLLLSVAARPRCERRAQAPRPRHRCRCPERRHRPAMPAHSAAAHLRHPWRCPARPPGPAAKVWPELGTKMIGSGGRFLSVKGCDMAMRGVVAVSGQHAHQCLVGAAAVQRTQDRLGSNFGSGRGCCGRSARSVCRLVPLSWLYCTVKRRRSRAISRVGVGTRPWIVSCSSIWVPPAGCWQADGRAA